MAKVYFYSYSFSFSSLASSMGCNEHGARNQEADVLQKCIEVCRYIYIYIYPHCLSHSTKNPMRAVHM